ncbi:MAG: YdcF family protein [Gammaproteobacteria bacterium]
MDIYLGYLLKALLLPPAGNLLLGACGWIVGRRRPRLGRALQRVALATFVLACVPLAAYWLAAPLENVPAFEPAQGPRGAEAIVILGGGINPAPPEFGGIDMPVWRSLERLHYGATLHRLLELPVAVAGGTLIPGTAPEGEIMNVVLRVAFDTPVTWRERHSRNTAENAQGLRRLMSARRILLVTHALHMRRARMMFEANGFEVIPAPTGFRTLLFAPGVSPFDFLPSLDALVLTHDALHEYVGLVWYRLRYLSSS